MKAKGRRILAIIFALALTFGSVSITYAEGAETTIKRTDTVAGKTQVTKDSTANLNLTVKRSDDTFRVYQLTTITWKETNGAQNATIDWNPAVKAWIAANSNFSDAIYQSPAALGAKEATDTSTSKAGETAVVKLLNAIKADATLVSTLQSTYQVAYHTDSTSPDAGNSVADATGTMKIAGVTANKENSTFTNGYTLSGLGLGLFFIAAQGTTRTYQPVLVNLIPEQTGPTGNWYINNTLTANLKYEGIEVTKKINGNDYDIVREGELVNFEVNVEVPKYVKGSDGNYTYTTFNGFDEMAQGFQLIPTSAKLYYYDSNNKTYHPLANMNLDAYGNLAATDTEGTYSVFMAEDAFIFYLDENTADDVFYGTVSTGGTIQYWGNVNGELVKLANLTDAQASYAEALSSLNTKRTAAGLDTIKYTSNKISKRSYTRSFISAHFNYTTMMNSATYTLTGDNAAFNGTPDKIVIAYAGKVTTNSFLGNDNNTNVVTVTYVGDTAGNLDKAKAEVKAWTYGANIVKTDGSTGDYLAGALFDLYRLDTTYCGGSTATAKPATTDYSTYTFYSDAENGVETYDKAMGAWSGYGTGVDATASTLYKALVYDNTQKGVTDKTTISSAYSALVTAVTGAGGYATADKFTNKYSALTTGTYKDMFKTWVLPQIGASGMKYQAVPVLVDKCEKCSTPHYHINYYSTMWTDIESAAVDKGAEGVTLTGLDPNTYLLIESKAPTGYNLLSEGVQFEVKQYNNTQYEAAGHSYKGFIRDDGKEETDGIYDLAVQNFKGLQLPSTGGIGTLIFTVIGICIMAGAIVFIVAKSKKRNNNEF